MNVSGLIGGSALIAASLATGPGYRAYLLWASALLQGTPSPLEGATLSPTGFPLLHHYLGTGVLLALPTFFTNDAISLDYSTRFAAAIAILLTMASVTSLLHEIAGKQPGLVLLGVSLLLVATNTGYYIRLIGAELFVLALAASITWLAWMPRQIGNVELLV